MTKSVLTIIICFVLCLTSTLLMFFVLGLHDRTVDNSVETVDKPVDNVCEHDWVTGSEYNFWTNSYRTVSKCSKCGKVVK